jgi:hypothetical protein
MIYTVKINDSLPSGKKLLVELRKHPKSVEFENQTLNDIVPEGYLTGDEFVERGKEKILKYYKENGLL